MSEFMDVVKNRRSIRRYETREIPQDVLDELFEAVRWSPSWANFQCWEFVVVKDPDQKAAVKECVPNFNPANKAMGEAPVVIAACGKVKFSGYHEGNPTTKHGDWFMFDLGLATQTLCLTAHHLGLGRVIAGFFDHNKVAEVLKLPEGYDVVALIPMGYALKGSPAPKRREISEFVHMDAFSA